jgi:hypothetical protein
LSFIELDGDQVRQLINTEQAYVAFRAAQTQRDRHRGAMAWKRVGGREYLYRKVHGSWKSLGPRDAETLLVYDRFREGRATARERVASLDEKIRAIAPVNRAMRLGRVPVAAAKILRRLERRGLLGHGLSVVGTNALFAYERMAGGHFAGSETATDDIDLLFDARKRLRMVSATGEELGLRDVLRSADTSFEMLSPGSFRAVNAKGFMVDLIKPVPKAASAVEKARIGSDPNDMTAAEIEGLAWLQSSPQIEQIAIDARGFPVRLSVPDPRAYALHKLWLAERPDRDPLKRRRDVRQAAAVTAVVVRYLPQMRFDDPGLAALPEKLRARVPELLAAADELGANRAYEGW